MYNWSQIYRFQQLSGNAPSLSAEDHWFDHKFFMFLYIFCFAKRYVTKFRLLLCYAKQYETKFRLIFRFAKRHETKFRLFSASGNGAKRIFACFLFRETNEILRNNSLSHCFVISLDKILCENMKPYLHCTCGDGK
jgi:hypothetical protein